MALTIAIEVGYTQIRALLLDLDPAVAEQPSRLPRKEGFIGRPINFQEMNVQPDLIDMVAHIAEEVADDRHDEVTSIGVACAAAVSPEGTLRLTGVEADGSGSSAQAPLQKDYPFLRPLRTKLKSMFTAEKLKVVVANRAAMAAWGEYKYGWGDHAKKTNLVYLHVGGGISAGIVTDGRLYVGESGYAGDFGHILVAPTSQLVCDVCHREGCLSSLVGGGAILNRLAAQPKAAGAAELLHYLGDHPTEAVQEAGFRHVVDGVTVDARGLVEAVLAGDRAPRQPAAQLFAQQVMLQLAEPLGIAVGQVACLLDPSFFVLGGILAGSTYLEELVVAAATKVIPQYRGDLRDNRVKRSYFWIHAQRLDYLSGDEAPLYGLVDWVRDYGVIG